MARIDQLSGRTATRTVQIIALCLVAACAYGVVHDQITVRICLEYFTVAHPPIFHTNSPTLLGFVWGIAATAGIGAALGGVLALITQSPGQAPYGLGRLFRAILVLLAAMGAAAFCAGVLGYELSRGAVLPFPEGFDAAIPATEHHRFMAVWFAHGASYLVGLMGSALLCWRIWRARGMASVIPLFPQTPAAISRAALLTVGAALVGWLRFR